jgi:hypothetical protein
LAAGAQDRLSWIVQLAAIVQARHPAAGERIVMQVAGPRGDADAWQFDVLGDTILETDAGRCRYCAWCASRGATTTPASRCGWIPVGIICRYAPCWEAVATAVSRWSGFFPASDACVGVASHGLA